MASSFSYEPTKNLIHHVAELHHYYYCIIRLKLYVIYYFY